MLIYLLFEESSFLTNSLSPYSIIPMKIRSMKKQPPLGRYLAKPWIPPQVTKTDDIYTVEGASSSGAVNEDLLSFYGLPRYPCLFNWLWIIE
jgi:hypothetical protein